MRMADSGCSGRYADVLQATQDWETFSAEHSLTVPATTPFRSFPRRDEHLHRQYRKLINPYFTPAAVSQWDKATRQIANQLIDNFIGSGQCEFMREFAEPFPGLALFDQVLHAPPDEIEWLTETAMVTSKPSNPESNWPGEPCMIGSTICWSLSRSCSAPKTTWSTG